METKHRYRLLIYFAALILCLSVCFANAEETTGATQAAGHRTIIFEQCHSHAAFMPALQQSFVTPAIVASVQAHVVPSSVLQQVMETHRSRHFWHGSTKRHASLVLNYQVNTSSDVTNDARNASTAVQPE